MWENWGLRAWVNGILLYPHEPIAVQGFTTRGSAAFLYLNVRLQTVI